MEKRYYVQVGGQRTGPYTLGELEKLDIDASTLVWTSGMGDWTAVAKLPELESIVADRPPPIRSAPLRASYAHQDQFLFFDPSRPRVLGLIILYGMVLSPLVYLIGTCGGFATTSFDDPNTTGWDVLLLVSEVIVGLVLTIALFVGAMWIRNRHQWGLKLTLGTLAVGTFGGVLLLGTAFVFGFLAAMLSEPAAVEETGYVLETAPTSPLLDVLGIVIGLGAWIFEWFAMIWLWLNRKRLTDATFSDGPDDRPPMSGGRDGLPLASMNRSAAPTSRPSESGSAEHATRGATATTASGADSPTQLSAERPTGSDVAKGANTRVGDGDRARAVSTVASDTRAPLNPAVAAVTSGTARSTFTPLMQHFHDAKAAKAVADDGGMERTRRWFLKEVGALGAVLSSLGGLAWVASRVYSSQKRAEERNNAAARRRIQEWSSPRNPGGTP